MRRRQHALGVAGEDDGGVEALGDGGRLRAGVHGAAAEQEGGPLGAGEQRRGALDVARRGLGRRRAAAGGAARDEARGGPRGRAALRRVEPEHVDRDREVRGTGAPAVQRGPRAAQGLAGGVGLGRRLREPRHRAGQAAWSGTSCSAPRPRPSASRAVVLATTSSGTESW